MMKKTTLFIVLLFAVKVYSQEITGNQLLEKAIQYHDPNNNWATFKGSFKVVMETPKSPKRISEISIDLQEQFFSLKTKRGTNNTTYKIDKNEVIISFNGETDLSSTTLEKNNLSKDRAKMYQNYYTYLYGLPMKLKDTGTIIHQKVARKKFKGKEYLVLKATYTKAVGKDTWYFYFNPKTFAMEVYQFFKETENSGEYILLSGIETINDIKIPKNRAWYYNKDNKYLGTDILSTY
ncbi:DUF6503 family protein [uncultured Polaribacter sp.]|uniref:DUF6503 family protein n=1 Tax=uncultured Polaribacter sp. TaxID=174711 RepID=UPI00260DED8A|nr:DUF6503 family protein [uncultured Polaribacter sp.]